MYLLKNWEINFGLSMQAFSNYKVNLFRHTIDNFKLLQLFYHIPASHCVQVDCPSAEKNPIAQLVGEMKLVPSKHFCPAGHWEQEPAFVVL